VPIQKVVGANAAVLTTFNVVALAEAEAVSLVVTVILAPPVVITPVTVELLAIAMVSPVHPVKVVAVRPVQVTLALEPTLIVAGILKPVGNELTRISLAVLLGVAVLRVVEMTPGDVATGGRDSLSV
jgi:hypothetical protein